MFFLVNADLKAVYNAEVIQKHGMREGEEAGEIWKKVVRCPTEIYGWREFAFDSFLISWRIAGRKAILLTALVVQRNHAITTVHSLFPS